MKCPKEDCKMILSLRREKNLSFSQSEILKNGNCQQEDEETFPKSLEKAGEKWRKRRIIWKHATGGVGEEEEGRRQN